LWDIAILAQGISARTLKKLVTYALLKHVTEEPGNLRDMLTALRAVISEEARNKHATKEPSPPHVKGPDPEGAEMEMMTTEDVLEDPEEFFRKLESGLLGV
jgi:hypothetical protein